MNTSRCTDADVPAELFVAGVKWWNRRAVSTALAASARRIVHVPDVTSALALARRSRSGIVSWASRTSAADENACAAAGIPLARLEDGFVRSVGLGAGLTAGCSFVVDNRGIYYDATRPSDLEHALATRDLTEAELARGKLLLGLLRESRISKYNVGRRNGGRIVPGGKRAVLVPGQVSVDAGVLRTRSASIDCTGSANVNLDLLRLARERNPGAFVIFKPHPDVAAGLRPGAIDADVAARYTDLLAVGVDIIELIEQCDAIETLSSLAGFEGLVRGKQVTVHGMPFYAGWSLTNDTTASERRHRARTLEELVFMALVEYGRYVDPVTGRPAEVETVIERLTSLRQSARARATAAALQWVSWFGRKVGL